MHRNYATGWLLDIYADELDGVVLWVLGEDGVRRRLTQSFRPVFYIGGDSDSLRRIHDFLQRNSPRVRAFFTERADLYEGLQKVLAVESASPVLQQRLFYYLKKRYKGLGMRFYDVSIPLSVRYVVLTGVFPTGRCFVCYDDASNLLDIHPMESAWDIEYSLPELRTIVVEPDVEPQFSQPESLQITLGQEERTLKLDQPPRVVEEFSALLEMYDPDIVLAHWGDGWLFPTLLDWAKRYRVTFNPSRDARQKVLSKKEMTFQSYGNVHYRAQQALLYGRWHLDPENRTTGGFSLHSTLELARITALPVQIAARNSPGAGFTAMQMAEALRRGLLVPEHKFQTERFKSAAELNLADNGGLNYRPKAGLHSNVLALDYFSMYPSVTINRNISGETVGAPGQNNVYTPETNVPINQDAPGFLPTVLKPIMDKRLKIKRQMQTLDKDDPSYSRLHDMADALKWLGYVSFGYQGFKHNLFGNIQAHEAICAWGREMLTRAIEAVHDLGYTILAANTDSLFVQKSGCFREEHFQPLIAEIERRTGLVIMPEAMFDWIIFRTSITNPRIGRTNWYFGRLSNGETKVRGLAQRRADTPKWVVQAEQEIIQLLIAESDAGRLASLLPRAIALLQQYLYDLHNGKILPSELVVTKRLSREIDQFREISEPASAARQLMTRNRDVRVGQKMEFLYVHGERPGVRVVDYRTWPDDRQINERRYCDLLSRAAYQFLSPLGLDEQDVRSLAEEGVKQLRLFRD